MQPTVLVQLAAQLLPSSVIYEHLDVVQVLVQPAVLLQPAVLVQPAVLLQPAYCVSRRGKRVWVQSLSNDRNVGTSFRLMYSH